MRSVLSYVIPSCIIWSTILCPRTILSIILEQRAISSASVQTPCARLIGYSHRLLFRRRHSGEVGVQYFIVCVNQGVSCVSRKLALRDAHSGIQILMVVHTAIPFGLDLMHIAWRVAPDKSLKAICALSGTSGRQAKMQTACKIA